MLEILRLSSKAQHLEMWQSVRPFAKWLQYILFMLKNTEFDNILNVLYGFPHQSSQP
jgi:hypothetical protein